MDRYKFIIVFLSLLSCCYCDINYEKKNKLVNAFIDFYNKLPNQIYICDEGYLLNAQQSTEPNSFDIEVSLKVSQPHNLDSTKYIRCTGKVVDLDDNGAAIMKHHCEEVAYDKDSEVEEIVVTEASIGVKETPFERKPIQLDNEIQTNTAVTSGEQFIAVPRETPKVHCIGCSSHVNPQAAGVNELASIGVRQLNLFEPNIKHTLNSVVDVERQVQVVRGIRYILTLIIDYNSCTEATSDTEICINSKACKVTVLEKPWMKLSDGSKYRAVLSNNCTEEWRFGDDGVVIPQTPTDSKENNNNNPPQTDGGSDIIKPIHNVDIQAQKHTEKTLTDEDIKVLEEQIIPHKQFDEHESATPVTGTFELTETSDPGKEHLVKIESASQLSPNSIPVTNFVKLDTLPEDKKKAIDDMLSFFNFAGFDSALPDEEKGRSKRSYDNDLNIMNLVDKFQKIKKKVDNAKYVYKLAQIVVDYLNEIDLEVKTRVLKEVLNAEEEFENHQHFYYVQSRIIIPCDKSECEEKDTVSKICNAVLDGTDKKVQILNAFCHDEPKAKPLGKVNSLALDDPVLLKLIKEATNKIESESTYGKAMKVNKIIDATTQRVSGTLTKFSVILDYTNCNKTVLPVLRSDCIVVEKMGSQVCDVTIHERHWHKQGKKITYTCIERPVDTSFSNIRTSEVKMSASDPAVLDMVNEALQYLDVQSNRNNKQVVVRVNSVATQLVAGFLTDIEFVVGYTTCPNDVTNVTSKCKLLEGEPLRICKAKFWDKTWIEDGRQVDVSCKEPDTEDNKPKRLKRDQLVGGAVPKDVTSTEIQQLANDALREYLKASVYHRHYDVIDILEASVQVVAGTLTNLLFKISPTNCLTDREGNPSSSDCKVMDYNDVTTCSSVIWEKGWLDFKQINTTCHDNENARVNRNNVVLVGPTMQDRNDPKYVTLAKESMQKYLQNNGNTNPHKLVSINNVTTRVVAGKMTSIDFTISPAAQTNGDVIRCFSKIWEKPWQNYKNIDVNCVIDQSRTKREVTHETYTGRKLLNIVGGETDKDTYDPEFKTLAKESLQKFLKTSGGSQHYGLISIQKATVQIVSGTKTKLEFSISPTNCQVDHEGNPSSSYCKIVDAGDVIGCSSEIIEQKWRNRKDIDVTCHVDDLYNRVKRVISGGLTQNDPNQPKYRKLAEESMLKYLQNNGNTNRHKLVSIKNVTTQVVAGTITNINFTISPADQTTGDVMSCLSNIWEKPWQNFKNIDVNCVIDQSRIKRDIFHNPKTTWKGGEQEVDPTKNEYKVLAQDSLRKYLKNRKNFDLHSVVEVKKVTKKIVSGIKYNIEYIAAPKSCAEDISTCTDQKSVLHCRADVWDRSWLGLKEIVVICRPTNNKGRKTHPNPKTLELKDVEDTIADEEHREKRQTDDYIDEDMSFYYADRAIKHLNNKRNSNNLHKLVSIHGAQNSIHMNQHMVRMYIETAETYCLRHRDENILSECEELEGMPHLLCLVKLWPSPDNEHVVEQVSLVCDDDAKFETVTGISVPTLIKAAIKELEKSPSVRYKLVHQGEPQVLPSLDSSFPLIINFIVASTNCSKHDTKFFDCFTDIARPSKSCTAQVWLKPHSPNVKKITAKCNKNQSRKKRSISLNPSNATADELIIQSMVQESLHQLEMASSNRYKQRVVQINSYSTKITSGKVTTIDFDVGYTSCLKFEWVDDVKTCEFLGHLPRRHCLSQVWERLWLENGRNIEVTCEEDETPLESHVDFGNAITAMQLANESLKYIDAKYPHPRKQKVVRIFSLEKQVVAGIHYRMKIEVGSTQCAALSAETDCKLDSMAGNNKFCRVNIWLRLWTDHPPNFRVTCDYQESASAELYHRLQAETLFSNFLATYKPEYINNVNEMKKRFQIFAANIRKIHELNIHEKGTATYGVTRFTDLSYEEFTTKFLGLKPSLRNTNQVPMRQAEIPSLHIPEKFDWRDFDAVTEVKNQGSCGSCWAFSVTGNIEGQWKMQSGQLVSLSEQELVDCDKLDNGCNGGLPDNAYRAIEQLGGLELENDYPYEGEDDKCSFNKTMSRVKITGAVNITSNETGMAKWLVQNGPISIGINANAMQFYMGGISHPFKFLCNPSNMDHGVLIVGYGVKDYPMFHKRLPYWTIKNSWGPEWGEQGYYRVYRGDGTCGVNQMASSAVI